MMPNADETRKQLYAHSKRPRWGFAILAWEGDGQRRYQFQDGQLRTFKRGYYELLEPVDQPADRKLDIVRELMAMLRAERGGRAERRSGFEDRVRALLRLYPEGFADPRWVADHRQGEVRSRQHRDAAIAEARERLSASALDAAIAAGDHTALVKAARAVISATDLAGSKDLGALRRLPETEHEAFALALRALLWGEEPFSERHAAFLDVLGRSTGERVTWPLATALTALVHPEEHAIIKPSVVRREAHWLAPSLVYDAVPSAELYGRMLTLLKGLKERLERIGQAPRDLFDVTDFLALPIRPPAGAEAAESAG